MSREINIKFDLEEKKCDDELIGTLCFEKGNFKFSKHNEYNNTVIRSSDEYYKLYCKKSREYKKMVVILESPHIDEFNVNAQLKDVQGKQVNSRPANGITGERFRKNFSEIINNKFSSKLGNNKYLVYLVNSIQYQCSLGMSTNLFRDFVWLNLWKDDSIRDDFIKRIKYIQPDVIINCCTVGRHSRGYNNGIMSLTEGSYGISVTYLKNIGYKQKNNNDVQKILDGSNNVVIEYKRVKEITLKNMVKYQLNNISDLKVVYEELSHPLNWY